MLLIDSIIRFAAVGLLLMFSLLLARDARTSTQGRTGFLLCLAMTASMLLQMPAFFVLPKPVSQLLVLAVIQTNIFFWWFCLSLFEDEFVLDRQAWLFFSLWLLTGIAHLLDAFGIHLQAGFWFDGIRSLGGMLIVLHISWMIWRGRRSDLVPGRRSLRGPFVLAANTCLLLIILSEALESIIDHAPLLNTLEALGILVLTIWGFLWLTRLDSGVLLFRARTNEPSIPDTSTKVSIAEQKLMACMSQDKAYLEQSLDVSGLATRIGLQEHQLRVLINQRLGFRNFSVFVNGYRIEEAKVRLADQAFDHIPILSIALDVGFGSIAPFNRSFQQLVGMTPGQYRKQ